MAIHIYQVDAFSSELFTGNPAAVIVLDSWPEKGIMQKIAFENNLSETAFITPSKGSLEIRWFTPSIEVDLCGHATLAAAHVMFEHEDYEGDEIIFRSKSGPLTVFRKDDCLVLDFPTDNIKVVNELPELIQLDRTYRVKEIYKGNSDLMFVVESAKMVEDFMPPLDFIRRLDCRGMIITAQGEDGVDFVSRFFAPQSGINEDSVTGSAHTTLIPYWSSKLGKDILIARQLSERGGKLHCQFLGNRVHIGGKCTTYFKGELCFDL